MSYQEYRTDEEHHQKDTDGRGPTDVEYSIRFVKVQTEMYDQVEDP